MAFERMKTSEKHASNPTTACSECMCYFFPRYKGLPPGIYLSLAEKKKVRRFFYILLALTGLSSTNMTIHSMRETRGEN